MTKRYGASRLVMRNVVVGGKRTSIRLEPEFWAELERQATARTLSVHRIVSEIHANYPDYALTSSVRVWLLGEAVR